MNEIEKAEKELEDFLKEHPEMQKLQEEIKQDLRDVGLSSTARMRLLASKMDLSIQKMLNEILKAKKMAREAVEKKSKRIYH